MTSLLRRYCAHAFLASATTLLVSFGPSEFVPSAGIGLDAQSCPNIPSGGGENLEYFATHTPTGCSVQNGTFVLAEAYGQCQRRALSCSPGPCTCVNIGDGPQLRKPANVSIWVQNSHPNSPFSIGPIYPNDNTLQSWDSRVPGQTTPEGRNWSTYTYQGATTLTFTENILTTSCNILPSQLVKTLSAQVLDCKPEWFTERQLPWASDRKYRN
jgi:hypothetical protein